MQHSDKQWLCGIFVIVHARNGNLSASSLKSDITLVLQGCCGDWISNSIPIPIPYPQKNPCESHRIPTPIEPPTPPYPTQRRASLFSVSRQIPCKPLARTLIYSVRDFCIGRGVCRLSVCPASDLENYARFAPNFMTPIRICHQIVHWK